MSGEVAGHAETSADDGEERFTGLIAKGASRSGGSTDSIQVRAQAGGEWQAWTEAGAALIFSLPDHPAGQAAGAGKGRWRQADVRRAIAAARKAGLQGFRIEIAPDGTIAIVVATPGSPDRGT